MSFGYGVGDVITVSRLAWTLYKSCKEAPESFNNIAGEVLSLHAVLKEVEESLVDHELSPQRQDGLGTIVQGCQGILDDLQALITKYESLGTKSKRTWDRMKWGTKDITELRSRLTSNTVLLAAFMSTSQITVQRQLDKLVRDFRAGRHEDSIISTMTVQSLAVDEEETWRAIRKELEDIGISVAAFDSNKTFIMDWFQNALQKGMFEEDAEDSSSGLNLSQRSSEEFFESSQTRTMKDRKHKESPTASRLPKQTKPQPSAQNLSSNSSTKPISHQESRTAEDTKKTAIKLKKNPGGRTSFMQSVFGSLIQTREAKARRFLEACRLEDYVAAKKELENGARVDTPFELDDNSSFLHTAVKNNNYQMTKWLLENGADVQRRHGREPFTPLIRACSLGNLELINLLLEHGASVNMRVYKEEYDELKFPLREAAKYEGEGQVQIMKVLLDHGALINDIQKSSMFGYDSALMAAAEAGREEAVRFLVEEGAEINATNYHKFTALMLAADKGHTEIVRYLLGHGADENMETRSRRDHGHDTAFTLALNNGHDESASLLRYTKNISKWTNDELQTCLHLAVLRKCPQTLEALFSRNVSTPKLEETAKGNWTALDYAFKSYDSRSAKLLLAHGARCRSGQDPPGRVYYEMGLKAYFDAEFMAKLGLNVLKLTDKDRLYAKNN